MHSKIPTLNSPLFYQPPTCHRDVYDEDPSAAQVRTPKLGAGDPCPKAETHAMLYAQKDKDPLKRDKHLPLISTTGPGIWAFRHKLDWLGRILGVEIRRHDVAQLLELDRLGEIRVEAGLFAFLPHVIEDVRGERDDGNVRIVVPLLPCSDVHACLITVFIGHH